MNRIVDGVPLAARAESAPLTIAIGGGHSMQIEQTTFAPTSCRLTKIIPGGFVKAELAQLARQVEALELSGTDQTTFEHPFYVRGGQVSFVFENPTGEPTMTPNVTVVCRGDHD
jgi:hypothetical protein